MKIVKYEEFKKINEASIGGMIKGALANIMNIFAAPFKDMYKDFTSFFKDDDPSTIKDIITKKFDQAIDAMQVELDKLQDENSIGGIMSNLIGSLVKLGNEISKDVKSSSITEDKKDIVSKIAKAVILGNKEAQWAGIVGLLDQNNEEAIKNNGGIKTSYKYNKDAFNKAIEEAGKNTNNTLKSKKEAAKKFLDSMQADIKNQMEKDFTDEELKTMFGKAGSANNRKVYTKDELTDFMEKKYKVIYLRKGKTFNEYKKDVSPEQQKGIVAVKQIYKVEDDKVIFMDDTNQPNIQKKFDEIVDVIDNKDMGDNAKKLQGILTKNKSNDEMMGKIATYAEFLEKPENKQKVEEIEKIIQ